MIYSLPNGKVIFITLEQYLELSDEDIMYLMSIDYGDYVTNPWQGSCISYTQKLDELDYTIDYTEDIDPISDFTILEDPLDEDFPDIPDEFKG